MNLLLWTADMHDDMLPVVEKLKKMGYDGVEVPIFDLNPEKFAAWGKRLDDLGLARTAVTVRSAADNPISSDAKTRAAGVANNKKVLDCCQAAGCTMLVGPYHSALGDFSGESRRNAGRRILEPLRVLFPQFGDRSGSLLPRRRSSELPHDLRHVPRQHRRKEHRRGHPRLRRLHGARAYFGKRPRHAG
jgi:sugar phosphate isomerase/epimerase